MLVALLLQAAIAQAPAPAPEARLRSVQQRTFRERCNGGLIYTREGLVDGASLYRPDQTPARAQQPLWKPSEAPEAGVYAAVERRVDGCPVPTPISVPNAKLKAR